MESRQLVRILVRAAIWLMFAPMVQAQQSFGVSIHNRPVTTDLVTKYVIPLNLSVRSDFFWKDVEQKQGELHIPDSDRQMEDLVKAVAKRGAKPLVVLTYGNQFYDRGDLIKSPEGMQAFIRYAEYVIGELRGTVTQFELWNEWNLNTGSRLLPHVWGDAGSYVNFLRTVYPALKAAYPDVVFVGGAVGGKDDNWINKFIAAGGLAYVDGFSVHPYVFKDQTRPQPPAVAGASIKTSRPLWNAEISTPEQSIDWLDTLNTRIKAAAPQKSIPIYVTEIGWPTGTCVGAVNDEQAANYIQRFTLLSHTRPWIGGVWWYDLQDDGADASNQENRFGLLQQTGEPKSSYTALAQIQPLLTSPTLATASGDERGLVSVQGESESGRRYVAAWVSTKNASKDVEWAEGSAKLKGGFMIENPSAQQHSNAATASSAPTVLIQK